jgi:hypothetical protein
MSMSVKLAFKILSYGALWPKMSQSGKFAIECAEWVIKIINITLWVIVCPTRCVIDLSQIPIRFPQ